MEKRYYGQNKEKKVFCFGCSAANLLLELGDFKGAENAYENVQSVSLGNFDGWFPDFLTGRVFGEITDNKYDYHLQLWQTKPITESIRKNFANHPQISYFESIVNEEIEGGRMSFVDDCRKLRVYAPALLLQENLDMNKQHVVALRKREGIYQIINDGIVESLEETGRKWPINYGALSQIKRKD